MTATSTLSELDRTVDSLVGTRGIRHAIIATSTTNGELHSAAAGPMSPEGEPTNPDTAFHYASVTKLYTSTAVMQLVEGGSIELDTPITTYLPADSVSGMHRIGDVDYTDHLTVRHLLAHTSGLPDYFLDTPKGAQSFTDRLVTDDFDYTLSDVLDRVRQLEAHFPPQDPGASRQRARYSDTNFQLLGAIVAAVDDQPFHDAIATRILQPLQLHDTWFAGHPRDDTSRTVASMWSGDTVLDRPRAMASMAPEGGLIGTANDALRFLRGLLAGELFARDDTLARMQARWNRFGVPRDRTSIVAPGWPIEYGLGIKRFRMPRLMTAGRRTPTLIGHTGASGSWLCWCPEVDLYLAGTVDQTVAAGVPYRVLPRLIRRLGAGKD